MCFNRLFRVSKQLNGIWHQLHFFSSLSWEKEVGEGIGVVFKMLKESWTKIWVRRLDLCCSLLFSSKSSSLILAARWDCLIISDFKDLFSHLRKKAWKRCTVQEDLLQWIVVWWKKIVLLTEDDWLFAKAQRSSSSETLSDVYFPHRNPLSTAPFDKII